MIVIRLISIKDILPEAGIRAKREPFYNGYWSRLNCFSKDKQQLFSFMDSAIFSHDLIRLPSGCIFSSSSGGKSSTVW